MCHMNLISIFDSWITNAHTHLHHQPTKKKKKWTTPMNIELKWYQACFPCYSYMYLHVDTMERVYTQFHVNQTKGWTPNRREVVVEQRERGRNREWEIEMKKMEREREKKWHRKFIMNFPNQFFSCWNIRFRLFCWTRAQSIISLSFENLIQYSEYFFRIEAVEYIYKSGKV